MSFIMKSITTAIIAIMPLVIAAIINLFIDQAVLAKHVMDIKGEFLRAINRIDSTLIRIENKIDADHE